MKRNTLLLCCIAIIAILVASIIGGVYLINSSEKDHYDQNEPFFSDRELTIISDESAAAPIEANLDKNTSKMVVREDLAVDSEHDEIIVVDGTWVSSSDNSKLLAELKDLLLSGKPIIIIPDEAGILYQLLADIGKSLGFMVYNESSQIFGFEYVSESGDVYCYNGSGYNTQMDALPDAYLWAEFALLDAYSKLSEREETSYVDSKTTVFDPYGSVRTDVVYTDLNKDRNPSDAGYITGYEIRYFVWMMPNSYDGYRSADVTILCDSHLNLNPTALLIDYFPIGAGTYGAPMFPPNSTDSQKSKDMPMTNHSNFGNGHFESVFDINEKDVMGAYNINILAGETVNLKSNVYYLDTQINVTFCHMDYGLLNFEKYNDYQTFEIKPTGYIGFAAEN